MPLDPAARVLRARIGAYAMHAKHSLEATTAAGRAAANRRFYDQVDPDRSLPEAERDRRAQAARRAHMTALAFRSAQARKSSFPATRTKTPGHRQPSVFISSVEGGGDPGFRSCHAAECVKSLI
jgi:hypothetical protein